MNIVVNNAIATDIVNTKKLRVVNEGVRGRNEFIHLNFDVYNYSFEALKAIRPDAISLEAHSEKIELINALIDKINKDVATISELQPSLNKAMDFASFLFENDLDIGLGITELNHGVKRGYFKKSSDDEIKGIEKIHSIEIQVNHYATVADGMNYKNVEVDGEHANLPTDKTNVFIYISYIV